MNHFFDKRVSIVSKASVVERVFSVKVWCLGGELCLEEGRWGSCGNLGLRLLFFVFAEADLLS